jgi:hypothetical protein
MIRKKILNCKLILPFFVINSEIERFQESIDPETERCPSCGSKGTCRIFASYERHVIDILEDRVVCRRIQIYRVLCSCGHTHALIPDFLVPYMQYSLPFILYILKLYFSHSMTVQALCEIYGISHATLYKWKRTFAKHKSWIQGMVRAQQQLNQKFLASLLSSPVFSDFTNLFFRQTLYSFLQTHANPANCSQLPVGWKDF